MTTTTQTTTRIIKGHWMEGGFRQRYTPLRVVVVDGKAYDEEMYHFPCGQPLSAARVTLDQHGNLTATGAAWEFLPDNGEVDRVGSDIFA